MVDGQIGVAQQRFQRDRLLGALQLHLAQLEIGAKGVAAYCQIRGPVQHAGLPRTLGRSTRLIQLLRMRAERGELLIQRGQIAGDSLHVSARAKHPRRIVVMQLLARMPRALSRTSRMWNSLHRAEPRIVPPSRRMPETSFGISGTNASSSRPL